MHKLIGLDYESNTFQLLRFKIQLRFISIFKKFLSLYKENAWYLFFMFCYFLVMASSKSMNQEKQEEIQLDTEDVKYRESNIIIKGWFQRCNAVIRIFLVSILQISVNNRSDTKNQVQDRKNNEVSKMDCDKFFFWKCTTQWFDCLSNANYRIW